MAMKVAFEVSLAAIIERINAIAPNRDVGQPNTVSNTRATMGDAAFNGWGGSGTGGFFSRY